MEQRKPTIDELTEDFHRYLRSIRRSEHTIRKYLAAWEKLKTYMAAHRPKTYTAKIDEAFLVFNNGYKCYHLTEHFDTTFLYC